ncbi:MAG: hypothetical protein HYS07_10685 [Chlamydiae bacterium]|nr:hypothetical protein [Chlamydiota bacterium]MBI3276891.1 hypothetical protein [Chlamydiota bacterium]
MKWFDTGPGNPFQNMAVDEALFIEGKNILRFYQWLRPAYSIGYFQKMNPSFFSHPVVRRMTGGGTVFHGEDFTFSLVLNLSSLSFLDSVRDSYHWIHLAFSKAFRKLGVLTEIYDDSKISKPQFCFQSPSSGDLLYQGMKIVGGAQRRRKHLMLHQGTVMLNQIGISSDCFKQAVLAGIEEVFKMNCVQEPNYLLSIKDPVQTLKKKYKSQMWTDEGKWVTGER